MSKLTMSPNNHHRHTLSMKSSLELALRTVSFNLQVRNITCITSLNKWIFLLKEIFAGIFVSIACWNRPYDFLESSDKPSKFNSFAYCSVILVCHWWYKLFVHWWMKGIHFASFYFCVWDLTREIRENKNPAKISTYTVCFLLTVCSSFNKTGHLSLTKTVIFL